MCEPCNPSKVASSSPYQLQCELNLPCRCLRGFNQARICERRSPRIENVLVLKRRRKVRAVKWIEKLRPELQVEEVRDPLDVIVFHHGKIKVQHPRAGQRVSAQVASKRNRIWHREALCLDVMVGIARIHIRTAPRTRHHIWHVDIRFRTAHPKCISGKSCRNCHARARLKHSAQLPSSQESRSQEPYPSLRSPKHPGVIHTQVVADIEVRESSIQPEVEEKRTGNRIRVLVPDHAPVSRVARPAPVVRTSPLRTVTQLLPDLYLQCVLVRAAAPKSGRNPARVRIQSRPAPHWRGPQISLWCQGWTHDVGVFRAE